MSTFLWKGQGGRAERRSRALTAPPPHTHTHPPTHTFLLHFLFIHQTPRKPRDAFQITTVLGTCCFSSLRNTLLLQPRTYVILNPVCFYLSPLT